MDQFDRQNLENDWLSEYKKIGNQYAQIAAYIIIFSYPTSIFANYNLVDPSKAWLYLTVYFAPSVMIALTLLLKRSLQFSHEVLVTVLVFSVFTSATYRVDEQSLVIYLITNAVCFIASSVQMLVFPVYALIYFFYILLVNILVSYVFYNHSLAEFYATEGGVVITVLGLVFMVVVQFRYRILKNNFINSLALKKSYALLEEKSRIIEEKSIIIEEKNADITSSISYAQRIQNSMLPNTESISKFLPEHFIYFKPRDIVSGDFYWFKEIEPLPLFKEILNEKGMESVLEGFSNPKFAIAAIDCTGHGVPGAFMSMIGDSLLNNIIDDKEIHEPDKILNKMHEGIFQALRQKETGNTDGMDIGLCVIEPQKRVLEFAGARNSLYYFSEGEFQELKGDHYAIGGFLKPMETCYTKQTIHLEKPSVFYLFSDGYQSQFGGRSGKKLMASGLRKILTEIHTLPMQEQRRILDQKLHEWMAESQQSQVDDILVIGFKIDYSSHETSE